MKFQYLTDNFQIFKRNFTKLTFKFYENNKNLEKYI